MLKSQQLLNMHEVFQPIIINLQTLDWQFSFKRIGVKLPYLIMIDIKFFQLLQIFKAVDFDDLIS